MNEFSLQELGTRIKTARKAKKKTQDEVAEAIGVRKNAVSEWERGVKQPGILNLLNYCNVLGMTLDELLDLKKYASFHLTFTAKERETIVMLIQECQQESDLHALHQKLDLLEQYLEAFFSRAESK
jgi:transcriptional regulator with XRE-family HTH domain